ncbi:MAG: HEAT repeat domain-containing protein [Polyangiales bacterium]
MARGDNNAAAAARRMSCGKANLVVAIAAGFVLLQGCASGPRAQVNTALNARDLSASLNAYDRFYETDGADPELLSSIAALLLQEEALSGDEASVRASVLQLRLAGLAGRPSLERLAGSEGVTLVRVLALEALMDAGNLLARDHLFGLLDSAPEFKTQALRAADPEVHLELLLTYFSDESADTRRAAALRFGDGEQEAAFEPLAMLARNDSEPKVRNAAVRSLGAYGAVATTVLVERLSDSDAGVRLAATRALVRADPEAATPVLRSLVDAPPSRASVEAARVVLMRGCEEDTHLCVAAEQHLFGVLVGDGLTLRSQAAVAVMSVPSLRRDEVVTLLMSEDDAGVRLQLARALRRENPSIAEDALLALLGETGMVRVQAAAELSEGGSTAGVEMLLEVLNSEDSSLVRQVAARALARRAGRPEELRSALEDRDVLVRIQAAGGILASVPLD